MTLSQVRTLFHVHGLPLCGPPVLSALCSQERNPLSVFSVVSVHGTTQPWSSTCGLTVGPGLTSAPCAWSSAAAWSPCRDMWRATQCRTSPRTGASTAPTCTPHISKSHLITQTPLCTKSCHTLGVALIRASHVLSLYLSQKAVFLKAKSLMVFEKHHQGTLPTLNYSFEGIIIHEKFCVHIL